MTWERGRELFEGGDCSNAGTVRRRELLKCGNCSNAATAQMRHRSNGGTRGRERVNECIESVICRRIPAESARHRARAAHSSCPCASMRSDDENHVIDRVHTCLFDARLSGSRPRAVPAVEPFPPSSSSRRRAVPAVEPFPPSISSRPRAVPAVAATSDAVSWSCCGSVDLISDATTRDLWRT